MSNLQDWKPSDADLISQLNKNVNDFISQMKGTFIRWHSMILGSKVPDQTFNEQFELQMGINVNERTIKDDKAAEEVKQ